MADTIAPAGVEAPGDADIIVVGAGASGLTCALSAAAGGAKVLLIEKTGSLGGTFLFANGTFSAANSRLSSAARTGDDPSLHFADALRIGHGKNNHQMLSMLVEHAGPTLDWLIDMGLRLRSSAPRIAGEHEPMKIPRTYYGENRAKSYLAVLRPAVLREIERGNIALRLKTRLTSLLRQDGAVVGVNFESQDGTRASYRAPFIVLATGGYGGNKEIIAKYHPGCGRAISLCAPFADGSALRAAEAVDAALVNMDIMHLNASGLPKVRSDWHAMPAPGYLVRMGAPNIVGPIWVSSQGKRIIDEDTISPDPLEEALAKLPDFTVHVIFDGKTRRTAHTSPIPAWTWQQFDAAAASGLNRQVVVGRSITELADKARIDRRNLVATIDNWNRYVSEGADPEFGRRSLAPLDDPPYYVVITKGIIMLSFGGLKVDVESRVIDTAGQVIPGLYAIGEAVGMGQFMGDSFVSGLGNGACLVFGKLVGDQLAGLASRDKAARSDPRI